MLATVAPQTQLAWWMNPDVFECGAARKMRPDSRWHYSSMGQGEPPTENAACYKARGDLSRLLKRSERDWQFHLYECGTVGDAFRWYAAHPEPGETGEDWLALTALQVKLPVETIRQLLEDDAHYNTPVVA